MNEVSKLVFLNTTLETLRTTRLPSQVTDSAPGLPGGRRYTSILRAAIGYTTLQRQALVVWKFRIVISYHNGLSTAKSGGYQDLPATSDKPHGAGENPHTHHKKVKLTSCGQNQEGPTCVWGSHGHQE